MSIDRILKDWARRNSLTLHTVYKEIEIRSVEIVDKGGSRFQIWVDAPDDAGQIGLHVWDFKRKRRDFLVASVDLNEYLENVLKIARSWAK